MIIDSYVYDMSKFGAMHPGGLGVLLDEDVGEWEFIDLANDQTII